MKRKLGRVKEWERRAMQGCENRTGMGRKEERGAEDLGKRG